MYPNQLVLVTFHSRRLLCHMPYWALPAKLLARSAWVDLKIVNKHMPEIIGWCFDFLLIPELFVFLSMFTLQICLNCMHIHSYIQIRYVMSCTILKYCAVRPRRSLRRIEKVCGVWIRLIYTASIQKTSKDVRLETCQDLIIKRLNFGICSTWVRKG